MRIEVSDEIQQFAAQPKSNYNTKAAGASSVSNDGFGAVFENGVTEQFIENVSRSGSEALDMEESAENKQMQKQLSTLANTTTEEELAQIKEETDDYEEEELETIVTVQEKIRMQLTVYCEDFDSGVLDDFSEDELAAIGVSKSKGDAIKWAKKLKEAGLPVTESNLENIQHAMELAGMASVISDGAMEYFIKNPGKEITIESLYLATYSSMSNVSSKEGNYYSMQMGGYLSQNTMGGNFDEMFPQIEKMLAGEGVTADEKVKADARWLFDRQLPINSDTISRLEEMKQLEEPLNTEQLLQRMTDAIIEGKLPAEASLTGDSLSELAKSSADIAAAVADVTDEQLKAAVAVAEGEVTIADINEVSKDKDTAKLAAEISDTDLRFITAKRQLEEIRLQMTIQSVAAMEKQGISVETTGLSELVEHLKAIENSYNSRLLESAGVAATEENLNLYAEVNNAIEVIKNSPAGLIGEVVFADEDVVLEQLEKQGAALAEKYKSAEEAYETVMTKPRADMGDSIRKAFRNVDDILRDMDLEVNRYNQRAVRILGYNNIEITHENINKVKAVDMQLNNMVSRLTPSSVIKMIRDDYNPMQATVEEINDKLQSYEDESFGLESKYSEFLWKMEQRHEISASERDAYIGIYRLVNQIEKSDGALVGALVSQGADITMENLLSALRTRKHGSMDYVVNDEFSGVEAKNSGSISEQIERGFGSREQAYYRELARNTIDNMNVEGFMEAAKEGDIMDLTLEQFAEIMASSEDSEEADKQYLKQQLNALREAGITEEHILSLLTDYDIPASLNNIAAAAELMDNSNNWVKRLFKERDNNQTTDIFKKAEKLLDSLTDSDTMREAYEDFANTAKDTIKENIVDGSDAYIDVRTMKLLTSQLTIASSMAKEEMYQVPVMLGMEMTTINLKFRYNTGESHKVNISMETQSFGLMVGEFSVKGSRVIGYLSVSTQIGVARLQETKSVFAQAISESTRFELGSLSIVQHSEISSSEMFKNTESYREVNSKELYQVAKVFIQSVKTTFV